MDGHEEQPVRLRVFRDEVQDLVPLNFGPLFAAARGRFDNDGTDAQVDGDAQMTSGVVNYQ